MAEKPDLFAQTPTRPDGQSDPFAFKHDAFSDVLELIRVHGNTVFACAASAPFGIRFPPGKHRLHIIKSGSVSIEVEELGEQHQASQGDLVMLMHGHGHVISDRPKRPAKLLADLARQHYHRDRLTLGSGDITWLCGDFGFDGVLSQRLLSVLPSVLVLKGLRERPFEWLDLSCHFILDEALNLRAGAAAMISRLLDVIFVQMLRTWANDGQQSVMAGCQGQSMLASIPRCPRCMPIRVVHGLSTISPSCRTCLVPHSRTGFNASSAKHP